MTLHTLSPRELEVLRLVAFGRSNRSICEALHLSDRTVESHVRSIYSKLGLDDDGRSHRRVLAAIAFRREAARMRVPAQVA